MATTPSPKQAVKSPATTPVAKAVPAPRPGSADASKTLAVIRIRGGINLTEKDTRTLYHLNIHRRNYCTLVPSTPSNVGMIRAAEPFVTWGEIDEATKKELIAKRGESVPVDGKMVQKPFFRLSPPRKGFERKGTKKNFSEGGALGYRGEKINDLIKRML